ncbi:hypothetical protein BF638R_0881 [Bacteroides fragilis 638R]|uniref:Uncharacterized protein n=1 Tax=Bacteroides fragilis (strain 638R) TaxID=862962 RepID=E1WLT8_BACF6|nr:hypothetical protein BF638R_0881 [Bacteroides fragilis 638R]
MFTTDYVNRDNRLGNRWRWRYILLSNIYFI